RLSTTVPGIDIFNPSIDIVFTPIYFCTNGVKAPPRDFHFSKICLNDGWMWSLIGKLRAFKSALGLAVDQKNLSPSRLVSITSLNIGGILGASFTPKVATVSLTPPRTKSVSLSTWEVRTK